MRFGARARMLRESAKSFRARRARASMPELDSVTFRRTSQSRERRLKSKFADAVRPLSRWQSRSTKRNEFQIFLSRCLRFALKSPYKNRTPMSSKVPDDLNFAKSHEWLRVARD